MTSLIRLIITLRSSFARVGTLTASTVNGRQAGSQEGRRLTRTINVRRVECLIIVQFDDIVRGIIHHLLLSRLADGHFDSVLVRRHLLAQALVHLIIVRVRHMLLLVALMRVDDFCRIIFI